MKSRFIGVLLPLAALGMGLGQGVAHAQTTYPCQLVKLISPYPPGGTTDILARQLQPGLGKELGVSVIVENKAGASSNIGTEFVATSAPDGCTLLLGNNTGVAINRSLYKLRVDPAASLAPVVMVASVPLVLYVNASVPANTFEQLIELVRKNPGKYSYASGGSGSPQHLLGEMLKLEKQLDLTHVPYKGQGQALQDVVAGQVQIAFETTTAIAPHLASGRVRVLATTAGVRPRNFKSTPTMKELGMPTFVTENWYGVFASSKTPAPLIQRLNQSLNKVMASKEFQDSLEKMGSSTPLSNAADFSKFIQHELPIWESVVKRSGAKVD